jgi:hypothetical protein
MKAHEEKYVFTKEAKELKEEIKEEVIKVVESAIDKAMRDEFNFGGK